VSGVPLCPSCGGVRCAVVFFVWWCPVCRRVLRVVVSVVSSCRCPFCPLCRCARWVRCDVPVVSCLLGRVRCALCHLYRGVSPSVDSIPHRQHFHPRALCSWDVHHLFLGCSPLVLGMFTTYTGWSFRGSLLRI
jgi:hypothetical protein